MPEADTAHSHPWKISDVVIFPLLLIGLLAEWLWPTSSGLSRPLGIAVGIAIAVIGFGLIFWSKNTLDRAGQPSLPGEPTTALVTDGPFAYSRNPNYLGAAIALVGAAVAFDSAWLLATLAATVLILDIWMIRPEERYLARAFPQDYAAYRSRTRRWL